MAKQQPRPFRISQHFADLTATIETSHLVAVSGQQSGLTLQEYRRIGLRLQKSVQKIDAHCRSLISHLEELEVRRLSAKKGHRTKKSD